MPTNQKDTFLSALQEGTLTVQGEFIWGSNYTFLIDVTHKDSTFSAVYKPTRGTRPLWDFPPTSLPRREVAAYLVSEALHWDFVPLTIFRQDGPFGPGSLQLFIEHDPEYHYFNFNDADRQRLRPVVLFDILVNNADRKGSHILFDSDEHLWLIDHGVCFHIEEKLRTVIWDFAGELIPDDLVANLRQFRHLLDINANTQPGAVPSELVTSLSAHLSSAEISAIAQRSDLLLDSARFPDPNPDRRHYPWPAV
ncbi:MAG: SCO1664 family protein [Anaerolineales bacterium]|nr:SCO1664 family protein [Anaerolineales bacterium]